MQPLNPLAGCAVARPLWQIPDIGIQACTALTYSACALCHQAARQRKEPQLIQQAPHKPVQQRLVRPWGAQPVGQAAVLHDGLITDSQDTARGHMAAEP